MADEVMGYEKVKLVNIRIGRSMGLCVVLSLGACNTQNSAPNPTTSSNQTGAAAPVQPAEPTITAATAPAATAKGESADAWLVVGKDGVELGVIELRAGKPPSFTAETDTPEVAELKTKLTELGGPKGLPLDMHLPTPSGTGRGEFGTRIITYTDPLYKHAMKHALEPTYRVKEVVHIVDPLPPAGFKRVQISRSGEKVGSIDFSSTPPKVTVVAAEKADGMSLKNTWESIEKLGELKVRYHALKGASETFVSAKAKPGDANYAEVAILYMMIERYYLMRHAYKLEFSQ